MNETDENGDDMEYCVDPEKMTREELMWTVKKLRHSNRTLTDMIPIDYIIGQYNSLDTSS